MGAQQNTEQHCNSLPSPTPSFPKLDVEVGGLHSYAVGASLKFSDFEEAMAASRRAA